MTLLFWLKHAHWQLCKLLKEGRYELCLPVDNIKKEGMNYVYP